MVDIVGRRYGVGFGAIRCATIPKPPDTPSGYRGWLYGVGFGAIRCATIPKPPDTPSGYRGWLYGVKNQ